MKLFCLIVFSLLVEKSLAASCCGGGMALPAMIIGDDAATLAVSMVHSENVYDVGADGFWQTPTSREATNTFRIESAQLLSDRWQFGWFLPVINKSRAGTGDSSGLGDLGLDLAYEYLPDWDYNPWRPKGVGFLQLVVPTGTAAYESVSQNQLDVRGRGLYTISVGSVLTKQLGVWDFNSVFEIHHGLSRTFRDQPNLPGEITVKPGFGESLSLGLGRSFDKLRMAVNLSGNREDSTKIVGYVNSSGAEQSWLNASLSFSRELDQNWTGNLIYTDQTLFGNPVNVALARSGVLSLIRKWER